ncbi:hypothetical protein NM65012_2198 [Neisseria meningitidis 65012]|nr:hypothetical protein NM65012_2198 [Neisseria meningitidis 65012]
MPLLRIRARFSSFNTAPPPVDRTIWGRITSFLSMAVSRERNPCSPSISNMVGMGTPAAAAIS